MQGEFQILAPLWRSQLSNCSTTGCKCSKPSSLWLLSWWALFLLRRDERRENPLQEGTRWSHSTPPPWKSLAQYTQKSLFHLLGSRGRSPGSKAHYLFLPVSLKGALPSPKIKFTQPPRMLMAPRSPSLCRICSWSQLIPSQAPLLEVSELWEVSLNGQTSSFSIIKFTDPQT